MIAALGSGSGNELFEALRRMLVFYPGPVDPGTNPSLANDPTDCGASDTTPLFLIALALFRRVTGESNLLEEAAQKALVWLQYQSPDDSVMISQQPTSDWRDEQWVFGYGLYINTLLYACLRLYGQEERARTLHRLINRVGVRSKEGGHILHEGLGLSKLPYYALWAYKVHVSNRFDLLGTAWQSSSDWLALSKPVKSSPGLRRLVKACEPMETWL
jgi:hypothetical protein